MLSPIFGLVQVMATSMSSPFKPEHAIEISRTSFIKIKTIHNIGDSPAVLGSQTLQLVQAKSLGPNPAWCLSKAFLLRGTLPPPPTLRR